VWLKRLGYIALGTVILQGILGGLRVTLLSTSLAMVHACLAQGFFCLTVFFVLVTSKTWPSYVPIYSELNKLSIRHLSLGLFLLIFIQLVVGAVMRHMEAGLAIPDFPLVFGKWIPDLPTPEIQIHFAHRVGGLLIAILMLWNLLTLLRKWQGETRLMMPGLILLGLIGLQIALGINIIWLERPPFVTTLHVMTGAAVLGTSLILVIHSRLLIRQ